MSLPALAACHIRGVPVHIASRSDVYDRIAAFVADGRSHQIVTVNMDFLRLAGGDAGFLAALNAADLAVPDGVPVRWLARLLGRRLGERLTGPDVMEIGAAVAAEQGAGIYLLGAEPGVADAAAAELVRRFPRLRIAGTCAPPFGPMSPATEAAIIGQVRDARPAMLFVAFGAPRQDVWIHRHLAELGVPVCVGVGGTFNFLAGRIPRAPHWMQRTGLEWAYRLRREPRRLWRRYLLGDLPVFLAIAGGRLLALCTERARRLYREPL